MNSAGTSRKCIVAHWPAANHGPACQKARLQLRKFPPRAGGSLQRSAWQTDIGMQNTRVLFNESLAHPAAQRGFTMPELLVVVVVLAVLLGIGVPSIRDFFARQAVVDAAQSMSEALQLARIHAIQRGAPVSICRSANPDASLPVCTSPESKWHSGWIVFVDRGTPGVIDGTDELIQAYGAVTGVKTTVEATNPPQMITYYPLGPIGGIQGGDHEITFVGALGGGEYRKSVCLSLMGRVRVMEGSGICAGTM